MSGNAQGFQSSPGISRHYASFSTRSATFSGASISQSPLVCLIDSRLAEQFFPGQDPIGQEIAMFKGWARIIRVVRVRSRRTSLEDRPRPAVYYSFAQIPFFPWAAVLVRSTGPAESIIRATVHQTNASVPVYSVRSLERLGTTLALRRAMIVLLSTLGAISLLLAVVGLYGVTAQVVSERTRRDRYSHGARRTSGADPLAIDAAGVALPDCSA